MYGWLWDHLPGNAAVKGFLTLVLVAAIILLLWFYVFPWAEPLLPFGDVTVDGG
ncbi:hypothetical protein [Cryptosporangium sp. NPDC051539]|uniref:hypothetical protein n=1 Tax=Cryptosporangium sp. NPDC051539 TaxID=3363962 RepID=UPI00378FBCA7